MYDIIVELAIGLNKLEMGDISILLSALVLNYNVGLLKSCLYRKMLVNL